MWIKYILKYIITLIKQLKIFIGGDNHDHVEGCAIRESVEHERMTFRRP